MLPVLAKSYIMTTYVYMQLCGEAAARGIALNHMPPPGWCEGAGGARRRSRSREMMGEEKIKCRPTFSPHHLTPGRCSQSVNDVYVGIRNS